MLKRRKLAEKQLKEIEELSGHKIEELRMEAQREIWLTHGILNENLNIEKLHYVVAVYKRINSVPEGYQQAILYTTHEEPEYLRCVAEAQKVRRLLA